MSQTTHTVKESLFHFVLRLLDVDVDGLAAELLQAHGLEIVDRREVPNPAGPASWFLAEPETLTRIELSDGRVFLQDRTRQEHDGGEAEVTYRFRPEAEIRAERAERIDRIPDDARILFLYDGARGAKMPSTAAYVPARSVARLGPDEAFRNHTGIDPRRIVAWDDSKLYAADGAPYS